MNFTPQIKILVKIRSHLKLTPKESEWRQLARVWGIEQVNLYQHLSWLRSRGFIVSTKGFSLWVRGSLADLESASGQEYDPNDSVVEGAIDLHQECLSKIRSITFIGKTSRQIREVIGREYSDESIRNAVRSAGGNWHGEFFYKFNSEVI